MTVEFKYEIDEKVETVLGTKGMVTSASLDNTNIIQYYVLFESGNGFWMREDQLKKIA